MVGGVVGHRLVQVRLVQYLVMRRPIFQVSCRDLFVLRPCTPGFRRTLTPKRYLLAPAGWASGTRSIRALLPQRQSNLLRNDAGERWGRPLNDVSSLAHRRTPQGRIQPTENRRPRREKDQVAQKVCAESSRMDRCTEDRLERLDSTTLRQRPRLTFKWSNCKTIRQGFLAKTGTTAGGRITSIRQSPIQPPSAEYTATPKSSRSSSP